MVAAERPWINFIRFCCARRVVVARVELASADPASVEIVDEEVPGPLTYAGVVGDAAMPDSACRRSRSVALTTSGDSSAQRRYSARSTGVDGGAPEAGVTEGDAISGGGFIRP